MQITDVKIRKLIVSDNPMKAVVSIVVNDSIAIHDIKVIENKGNTFIAMPSRIDPNGVFRDSVHPLNAEIRKQITDVILDAYKKELEAYIIKTAKC